MEIFNQYAVIIPKDRREYEKFMAMSQDELRYYFHKEYPKTWAKSVSVDKPDPNCYGITLAW